MKRLFAIVTMLVALVSACGKKGDPRAPELATPRTITNLTARSEPERRRSHLEPADRVCRRHGVKRSGELRDFSQGSFAELVPIARCRIASSRPSTSKTGKNSCRQKQYRYDDEEVRPKAIYRYRVSSQLFDGSLSAPSNEVEVARGDK